MIVKHKNMKSKQPLYKPKLRIIRKLIKLKLRSSKHSKGNGIKLIIAAIVKEP